MPCHGFVIVAMDVAWTGLFVGVGAVTVIFAAADRTGAGREECSAAGASPTCPASPPRAAAQGPGRSWIEHVAGIVVQTLFILWWVGVIHFWPADIPTKAAAAAAPCTSPSPRNCRCSTGRCWPPRPALIAVNAAEAGQPRDAAPSAPRSTSSLQVALIALAGYALHAAPLGGGDRDAGVPALVTAEVQYGVGIGAEVTLIIVICSAILSLGFAAWRLFRALPQTRRAANGA